MNVEVEIEGVSDVHLEKAIRRSIQKVCKDTARPGEWSVFVAPSETRGEWDLLVRGPFGRHMTSFTEHMEQLPGLVSEHVRTCLSAAVNA